MQKKLTAAAAGIAAVTLAVTGCSTKASDDKGGGDSGSGDVKTDVGVTDDTITLGSLADHSGVFKVLSLAFTEGDAIWADEVNEAGGICGRDIVIDLKDTGYKVDNAIPLYEELKGTSLGIIQMVGSPILAALKTRIEQDNMVVSPGSWASVNLDAPEVMMVGQTYDVEMINGLSYLQSNGMIADGDTIGHIYTDSEYGQGGVMGSKYYAEQHKLNVIEAPIGGTDTDMTATITKMKSQGVTAIAITTPPAAVASTVVQNVAQGLNVPVMGNNPTFSPTMYTDETVAAGLEYFYQASSVAPYGSDNPLAKKVAKAYEARTAEPPNIGVMQHYVTALAWGAVLEQACKDGDLTREGIVAAKEKVDSVDSQGLGGELDFSVPGAPSSRESYILAASNDAPDKLVIAEGGELFESPDATEYKAPHQK
jgi:ABC-type branched-subunit amino acid transport system substrate-binding protein